MCACEAIGARLLLEERYCVCVRSVVCVCLCVDVCVDCARSAWAECRPRRCVCVMRGTIQSWRRATVCGGLLIFFLYGSICCAQLTATLSRRGARPQPIARSVPYGVAVEGAPGWVDSHAPVSVHVVVQQQRPGVPRRPWPLPTTTRRQIQWKVMAMRAGGRLAPDCAQVSCTSVSKAMMHRR